ncbi:MAG TPA: hypothetical protein VIF88_14790 [Methylocystis sp.]|jgi:hypothetical protein
MTKNVADAFIAAVKKKGGFARDEDLALRHGWTKGIISNWRQRGHIPEDKIPILEAEYQLSYSVIASDFAGSHSIVDLVVQISFLRAFKSICEVHQGESMLNSLCVFAAIHYDEIHAKIKDRVLREYSGHVGPKEEAILLNRASNDAFLQPDELVQWLGPVMRSQVRSGPKTK